MFVGKFLNVLMPRWEISLSASGPLMYTFAMWCDWSNSTHVFAHASCSFFQLENSVGTTG